MFAMSRVQPRPLPGLFFRRMVMKLRPCTMVVLAAAGVTMFGVSVCAQTCLRPKWTECVSLPNGGRHTGINAYGVTVEAPVPPASEICVINEWEIQADTYAQFQRNGEPWPERDWEVRVETFCFYKND
jgi:hypothetical protein